MVAFVGTDLSAFLASSTLRASLAPVSSKSTDMVLQPSVAALTMDPESPPPLPICCTTGEVSSMAEAAQQIPNQDVLAAASSGTMAEPLIVKDPTMATSWSAMAVRPQAAVLVGWPCSSHVVTSSGCPLMPPWALTQSW